MPAAKARDAASLIIYRNISNSCEVLMGRRRGNAGFAPGVYVFPGGTLETADKNIMPVRPFRAEGLNKRAAHRLQALALTAIRETFEETGLLLGEKGRLETSDHPSWERCRKQGLVPAPLHLDYLGRAITPTESARRFHARFFVAPLGHFSGSLIEEGELLDLRWVSIDSRGSLPMFDVTEFMLDELQRYLLGQRAGTPIMSYRNDRTLLRYE